jgi:adenine deaminase
LGHINLLVSRALAKGFDLFDVLRAASLHPVEHYRLPIGLLREGDSADFIIVNNLTDFIVERTFIKGKLVADNGKTLITKVPIEPINQFNM